MLAMLLMLDQKRWVWAGAFCGLLVLSRPSAQFIVVVVAVWVLWQVGWKRALTFVGMTALLVVPWVLRNWIQVGEPVLVSSNGFNLAASYSPQAKESNVFVDPVFDERFSSYRLVMFNEAEWDKAMQDLAIKSLKDDPGQVFRVIGRNTQQYFELDPSLNVNPESSDGRNLDFRDRTLWTFYVVTVVGLFGLIVRVRQPMVLLVLAIAGRALGAGGRRLDGHRRRLSNQIARGLNVVMLARGAELLEAEAPGRERHGVEVRTLSTDLADTPAAVAAIAAAVEGLDLGLFVYNAAVAPTGRFADVELDVHLQSIAVNCTTPTALCHLLVPGLVARGRGGIALLTSMGASQGSVNFSTYNAGKAYEWILAESLWTELADHGVDVATAFVGATASPNYLSFQETLDPDLCDRPDTDDPLDRARWRLLMPSQPEEVATAVLDQLGAGPGNHVTPTTSWSSRPASRSHATRPS